MASVSHLPANETQSTFTTHLANSFIKEGIQTEIKHIPSGLETIEYDLG